jgi:hypothetical protein
MYIQPDIDGDTNRIRYFSWYGTIQFIFAICLLFGIWFTLFRLAKGDFFDVAPQEIMNKNEDPHL